MNVTDVSVTPRQVSTFESLAGGLDSRQLNQNNNLHFSYLDPSGTALLLRVEMLTGITVMGQAKKCREFEDRLRNLGIAGKFRQTENNQVGGSPVTPIDIPEQISKLAQLRDSGVLSDAEFDAKKAELLDRL